MEQGKSNWLSPQSFVKKIEIGVTVGIDFGFFEGNKNTNELEQSLDL